MILFYFERNKLESIANEDATASVKVKKAVAYMAKRYDSIPTFTIAEALQVSYKRVLQEQKRQGLIHLSFG